MSKKFVVEIPDDDVSCKDVKECFLSESYLIKSENVTVTELQPLPEVKKVETGILNIPNLPDNFSISDNGMSFYNGDYVDLNQYPELRELCTVKSEIDYGIIKNHEKIIIECEGKYKTVDDKYLYFCNSKILKSTIKSIRIVELPRDEK